jgi:release factor glutamine methyltransferase
MDDIQFHRLLKETAEKLKNAGIDAATTEVEIILETLLEVERINVYLYGARLTDDTILKKFNQIIKKRITRQPLQYILGETNFYGRKFMVNPDVMVPTPETELLCELAVNYIKNENLEHVEILDIGVGSGVVGVTIACELSHVWVTAVDISQAALAMARKNAAIHEIESRIRFLNSDLFSKIDDDSKFDLILSNPPYIAQKDYDSLSPEVLADPKISLVSGVDGLDIIRKLIKKSPDYLKEKGRLMFEIGYDQAEMVKNITDVDVRYKSITIIKDLNDIDRVVILGV